MAFSETSIRQFERTRANLFGQEDFCQEDIEAAADYISS